MITVGKPVTMTPPCTVLSPMRAAGLPPIKTVADPLMMVSGGPAQVQRSPTLAAGMPPIMTVGQHGGRMGPPTCGTGPLNMGQVCMSVIREAGGTGDPQFRVAANCSEPAGICQYAGKTTGREDSCPTGQTAPSMPRLAGAAPGANDEIHLKPAWSVASLTGVPYKYPYC
jgi:hypothetical protein